MEESYPASPEYQAMQHEMRKLRRLKKKHGDWTGMIMYVTGFSKAKLDTLGGLGESGRTGSEDDSSVGGSWGRTQSCLLVLLHDRVPAEQGGDLAFAPAG